MIDSGSAVRGFGRFAWGALCGALVLTLSLRVHAAEPTAAKKPAKAATKPKAKASAKPAKKR